VKNYDKSPVIYFENKGTSLFMQCSVEGCSVCIFEVKEESNEYARQIYTGHINKLCFAADIKKWTDSNRCYDIAEDTVRQVQNVDSLLLGLTDCRYVGKGVKRGAFNVLGEVSKIRFGTIECDDAYCYNSWAKFRKYVIPFEGTIVCRKIVLGTANSTLSGLSFKLGAYKLSEVFVTP
jgi:hypothetical protein